jgi:cytochrome bd-type quinol oxidase subunit 2
MSTHDLTVGSMRVWWAFVPVLAGAAVAYLLRRLDLPEFGEVAGAVIATLVTGAPFYRRAVEHDEDRAIRESPGCVGGRPAPAITAGHGTIALSIVLGAAAFAVWLSHRLRAAARPTLTRATGLYVAAALVTDVAFAIIGERMLSSAEVIVPLLIGVLVWLVTVAGCGYARRTQARFDAMRMALAR